MTTFSPRWKVVQYLFFGGIHKYRPSGFSLGSKKFSGKPSNFFFSSPENPSGSIFVILDWKMEIPIVMKLMALMSAIAATSAFAERTFSLARRLKIYL